MTQRTFIEVLAAFVSEEADRLNDARKLVAMDEDDYRIFQRYMDEADHVSAYQLLKSFPRSLIFNWREFDKQMAELKPDMIE